MRNFSLVLQTDFDEIDFPQGSISPTHKEAGSNGWKLTWQYSNLLTGAKIGMITPQKLNPGPWTSRLTATAPVSLFLFFFLMFVFTTVKKIRIHPMNYFFVAAAFFSFHLLSVISGRPYINPRSFLDMFSGFNISGGFLHAACRRGTFRIYRDCIVTTGVSCVVLVYILFQRLYRADNYHYVYMHTVCDDAVYGQSGLGTGICKKR